MPIEFVVSPELRRNFPSGGELFLEQLGESLNEDAVRSVLLFGSVVSGETTAVSDIDLLVVLEDDTDQGYRGSVRARCLQLAEQYLAVEDARENPIERGVDRATGMFRSGFVVTASEVERGTFHAIFNTSRLAYVLAPWRTVLAAVFDRTVTLYGPSLAPDWNQLVHPSNRAIRELLRSWLISTLLAAAQLVYGFVSTRSIRYSMEAHKWTLYNCAFHLTDGRVESLHSAADIVPVGNTFNQRLLTLRDEPGYDPWYMLLAPAYVTLIHFQTIAVLIRPK